MKEKPEASVARKKILKTASDLFYRQGYLATGINQVIAESKVAKNTFYYHFPSKEALCAAYLQERHQVWMWWFHDKVNSYPTPLDRLLGVFDFLEQWMENSHFRGSPFGNILSEIPDMNSRLRHEVTAHADAMRQALHPLVEGFKNSQPELANLDLLQTADTLFILFEGASLACQNYGDIWPVSTARESFKKLILNNRTDLSVLLPK